jgi:hypothetical protein
MREQLLSLETKAGNPIPVEGIKLVPFSRVLHLRLPFLHGGLIWNRPVSVLITSENGKEQLLPIHDYTRLTLWTLLSIGILGSLLISWISRQKDRRRLDER